MPQSPERSRHSRRDDHRGASRHADDPRHRRSQRSLSPRAHTTRDLRDRDRNRDRERDRHSPKPTSSRRHRSPHRERAKKAHPPAAGVEGAPLPFGARPLRKADFAAFEPLFIEYLELQKQRDARGMDEREMRGRWKSFVGKWNRGDLAEGWYDPEVFQRAASRAGDEDRAEAGEQERVVAERRAERARSPAAKHRGTGDENSGEDEDRDDSEDGESETGEDSGGDDEDYGPVLPGAERGRRSGVAIPSVQDLALRDEMVQESREAGRDELRAARKADRKQQKERLEELAPRAEAGTRERKLEKRREVNDKMRQFREKSPGVEVGEKELMGGGDSVEEYRRDKERDRKRKSEREARREEIARARREEIEVKRRAWQEREDKTVSMLRELAKQRFG